ncbi:branched-chain amino acid ABC transporter permease [Streptomyces sp. H10-C2]|uniref:branched-chain amino acid ABC transporter permease n=1 Tax=unclassified Streptomyces TaxID=2593676 RepID=UPI0024B97FD4|nr:MULTISPECIES: branched-chain amino acid ABC transporter permease [unclassified Streptomyces]MDJ0341022.1 branched-chain amino acid ABC transporter permease [Streptomyces sp. PH10-H1]MDJ0369746.1 branched-chain amino acid ABC transporter permease [Streptomyces sp. H10-C2]
MCLTDHFWQFLVPGLTLGALYALVAIGYTLVYGVLQLINFAHSEVFMSGGFGGLFVTQALVGSGGTPHGFDSVLYMITGIAIGAVVGGCLAFLLERVAYRPLRRRNAPRLVYLITAIGASIFLFNLTGKMFGRDKTNIPELYTDGVIFRLFGAQVRVQQIVIVVTAVVMMVLLDTVVSRTKLGAGIRAVAQDAQTASLMGVNINRVISQTFVIGGLLGGAAGFLFGSYLNVHYQMGFLPGIKAFAAAVLGGIGNIRGAMLGGLLLGIVENLSQSCMSSQWIDVIAFIVLILVLMFRPTGILGQRLGRAA